MNEYEQAIWNFRVTKPAGHLLDETKLLQELVDLHTPTKHLRSRYDNMCPSCKGSTLEQNDNANYCHQCGQALDWT